MKRTELNLGKKTLGVFRKTLIEQLRSGWDLALVFLLIPLFIGMYWLFLGGGSTSYNLLVLDNDRGRCSQIGSDRSCASEVIDVLENITYKTDAKLLHLIEVDSREAGERLLRERGGMAMVIFPPDFSDAARSAGPAPVLTLVGDINNPYYTVPAIMVNGALDGLIWKLVGFDRPINIEEQLLGESGARSEFEIYVPGLLIAAVSLIIFSVAIAISREIEFGTIRRIQMAGVSPFSFLGGISLVYVLIGMVSVFLAYGVAVLLGFHSQGPLWLGILVSILTSVASIGIGLLTACFSRTVARAAIIANFPLMFVLFFSGAMFPLPEIKLFSVSGRIIRLQDFIPQTHATIALNKIFSLGFGLQDVSYELVMLVVLTVLYFVVGVWLFKRLNMRAE